MAKGVKHYLKDGKAHTGSLHKMSDGKLHSGKTHTASSKKLYHYGQLSVKSRQQAKKSWGK